jgi:hypothetical protein
MSYKVYAMNAGNCMWYKYYCPRCREWYEYTTAWNLSDYNQCEHRYDLPWSDGAVHSNPAWTRPGKWVVYGDLVEEEEQEDY